MGTTGLLVAAVVLIAATVFGVFRKAQDGKVRPVSMSTPDLADLGVKPGSLTLLQFSSAFCAPCRSTRVVCSEVARTTPGVEHVEADAERHLEVVRALGIRRTPTVLVVAPSGEIVGRAEGAPTLVQVRAALGVFHA